MENSFILTGPHWSELPTRAQILSRPSIGQELVAFLEAQLPPEQVPYLDAFLADDEPKDIAPRLGISTSRYVYVHLTSFLRIARVLSNPAACGTGSSSRKALETRASRSS